MYLRDARSQALEEVRPIVPLSGAGGTRTPYLGIANAALSQLSYSPTILQAPGGP